MIGNRDELTANKSITQNIILCNGGPMEKNRRMRDILRSLCAAPPARLACVPPFSFGLFCLAGAHAGHRPSCIARIGTVSTSDPG